MDERAFTGALLSQLAGSARSGQEGAAPPPAPDRGGEGPRILVAADGPEREAVGVLQEACALRRFGFEIEVLARRETAQRLRRCAPTGTVADAAAPLREDVWTGLHAVLAVPTQDLLARMALGLQDAPLSQLVLGALWRGIPVCMDFSCAQACGGVPCASPALAALYDGYARQLTLWGARAVVPGEYLAALRPGAPAPAAGSPPARSDGRRRVVTRGDVLSHAPREGVWTLPGDAMITALARDTARKQGLILQKEA